MIKTTEFFINRKSFGSIKYFLYAGNKFINLTNNSLDIVTNDNTIVTIPPATKSKNIRKIYEYLYGPDDIVKSIGIINVYGRPKLPEEYKTFYIVESNNKLDKRDDILIPVKVDVDDDMKVFSSNINRFSTMTIDNFGNDSYSKYRLKLNE